MLSLVTVRLLDVPYSVDKDYDYRLPDGMPVPEVGRLLLVPFGASNRLSYAVAVSYKETASTERSLKEIYALLPPDYRVFAFFFATIRCLALGKLCVPRFPRRHLGN